ncbi:2026_t:CDS:2 [Cetraspora pellucida]|uniref:2026_t:CDS:1 n=1 Tax=Cetraspora pellucida TaxID=1433469 RepID=A0A9N9FQQ9_9GLOM|nr:2026_t:CDS:2 [Cetraspora pellucida]
MPRSDIDEILVKTLHKFKNILIQQIYYQLPLNFTKMRRKVYKCRFHGKSAYSTLTQILENSKWGQKCYDQN